MTTKTQSSSNGANPSSDLERSRRAGDFCAMSTVASSASGQKANQRPHGGTQNAVLHVAYARGRLYEMSPSVSDAENWLALSVGALL
jgi:hypothetical protein